MAVLQLHLAESRLSLLQPVQRLLDSPLASQLPEE
jgi:hypothetical protein